MQFIQEFFNDWYGEFVDDGHGIEMSIVDTMAPSAVLFLHQNRRRGKLTDAVLNDPRLKQLCNLWLYLRFVLRFVAICSDIDWLGSWHERDAVITRSSWWQFTGFTKHIIELHQYTLQLRGNIMLLLVGGGRSIQIKHMQQRPLFMQILELHAVDSMADERF